MDRSNLHDTDVFASKSTRVPRKSTARKSGRQSIGPGELTPPSSGSQHEREPPRMLMSPPPEEELRVSVENLCRTRNLHFGHRIPGQGRTTHDCLVRPSSSGHQAKLRAYRLLTLQSVNVLNTNWQMGLQWHPRFRKGRQLRAPRRYRSR